MRRKETEREREEKNVEDKKKPEEIYGSNEDEYYYGEDY